MENNSKDLYKNYLSGLPLQRQFRDCLLDDTLWDKNPQFYYEYPQLFWAYYSGIKQDIINKLSIAGFLYYQSTLFADVLIDEKDLSKFPLISISQEEAIKILTSVFGLQSDFWKRWNQRRGEYFKAVAIEKQLYVQETVDFKEYEILADFKSAFGKVAVDCLQIYSADNSNDEIYESLLLSHKYFSIGFQLYDDVKDFKEDFEKRQFNWAVFQFKNRYRDEFENLDIKMCNKLLFIRGLAQDILKKAIVYFDKALYAIENYRINSKWGETIEKTKGEINNYLDITEGYLLTLNKRIEIEKTINPCRFINFQNLQDSTIKNGLIFIQTDYCRNFSELKHIMYLSDREGFENDEKIHVGDIFQRSMMADCLHGVSRKWKLNSESYIETEINYLIENRLKDDVGAWSYFPTVKEIAADIDDLGQIIQLLAMSDKRELIDKYCTKAIDTAINERSSSNGGIETWIIPHNNLTPMQETQDFFNRNKWGMGPDTEVMANFIYALFAYNPIKYNNVIKNGIDFILNRQNDQGFWESRWYYGNFYGTYVCTRLLSKFNKEYDTQLNKAYKYLTSSQNKDGGWGLKQNSDSLNTALALLAINKKSELTSIVEKGKDFLVKRQQPDGSWDSVDFIKPKTQESYKSKTLTTAFVLKALSQ